MAHKLFLSRRNLLTLLSKLDRDKEGEPTQCTIVKNDSSNPKFPQTMTQVYVIAVEDDAYYTDRDAGDVLPADDPSLKVT